jgi:hypothetical protein
MQTFLPYEDYRQSAVVLDVRRLGKQRVEAYQIAKVLLDPSAKAGWRNHPAVRMWRGYERSLIHYTCAMCDHWTTYLRADGTPYQDTIREKIETLGRAFNVSPEEIRPAWLGDEDLHRSHQSNLIRKLSSHYQSFWPGVSAELPYVWPV